jgi:hypothetical protein
VYQKVDEALPAEAVAPLVGTVVSLERAGVR